MARLHVDNAALMRLLWAQGGVLSAINVMGVVNAGGIAITQTLTNTVGAAIKSGFTSSGLVASIATNFSLVSVGLRDIRSVSQPEFLDTGGPVAGTSAGDLLPLQTALCITLRTALAGQHYRGRTYLCGYSELVNTPAGAMSGSAGSVAFLTAIKAALVSNALDLGVLSRPNEDAVPPSVGFITPVTSIVSRDLVWDTQRRRAIPGV